MKKTRANIAKTLAVIFVGLMFATLGLMLTACNILNLSDDDKAKLQADAKAAYEAAKPQLEQLASDVKPIVEQAVKDVH